MQVSLGVSRKFESILASFSVKEEVRSISEGAVRRDGGDGL